MKWPKPMARVIPTAARVCDCYSDSKQPWGGGGGYSLYTVTFKDGN